MITEDYCSFEVAKLLKKKGFPQDYDIYHSMVYNEEDYEYEYEIQRMVLETRFVKAGTLSSYPVGVPEPKCYCPTYEMAMKWLREAYLLFIDIDPLTCSKWSWSIWFMNDPKQKVGESPQTISTYEEACEAAIKYCLELLYDYRRLC